jgi:hypothetical protein
MGVLYNLAEIRKILNKKYDDPELDAFCLDHFRAVFDKFSRGMRKDEKITLLLDYCRRLPIRWHKLLRLVGESPEEQTFHLPFANRETEKKLIRTLLESNFYVQIHAAGGLGKTYMLREMQRELKASGGQTVWIDFASELHAECRADLYRFLEEFCQQVLGEAAFQINTHDEDYALQQIGRKLADLAQVTLFLDNADWADMRLLRWIRETFLQRLATTWVPISVLASGQQIIPEWMGLRHGRPFQLLRLSEFDDPKVISEIIDYVVTRFGAEYVKAKWNQQNETWQAEMSQMVDGLLQISRGHPLIMAEVLRYTANEDGFMHATYFTDNWAELCQRCLIPIVGGRILPTIEASVREALRSLCIFRYVWPMLIRSLTNRTTPDELGGPWEPFGTSRRSWANWWSRLKDTHLIHDATRQIHPISPVIRQVINLVLQCEDESLYRARNRRARQEYKRLLASESVVPTERAAYLLELFYHATQDGSLSPPEAGDYFEKRLNEFLNDLSDSSFSVGSQLLGWLREDTELQGVINQLAGSDVYARLIQSVDDFITHKQM